MKRIIVSVTNDLTTDQRVHKVCTSLQNMGFGIVLVGRRLPNSKVLDRLYKTIRMRLWFNKGFLFYAEYNIRLFFKLFFTKKHILLSNDLDTLLPNFLISKLFRIPLVYDSHELFTEVPELINRLKTQKFWQRIEKIILPKLNNCYTVSNSIANYYKNAYYSDFKIIRNLPYRIKTNSASAFPFDIKDNKVILYQGALNKGRGLELIINAMPFIDNALLVIIGDGDIKNKIKQLIKQKNLLEKVILISRITPDELCKITPLADLVISLEEDLGLNYRYALPNKLFDYIQANIPVLVSDLVEMKEIVLKYKVGEIVADRNPKAIAKQITVMLEKHKNKYQEHLKTAAKILTWQNESKILTSIFSDLK